METPSAPTVTCLFHFLASMFTGTTEFATTGILATTSDKEPDIVARYQAGESQVAIAKALAVGRESVRRTLKERGMPLHPQCPVSGPHRQAILVLHASGKTIKGISEQLGVNFATVYRVLLRNGRVKKKDRKQ